MKFGRIPFKLLTGALLVTGLPLLAPSQSADAAILAQYTFPTNGNFTSSDSNPNSTATPINKGSGIVLLRTTGRGNPPQALTETYQGILASSRTQSLTNNAYWSFTLAPQTTFGIKYDNLTFQTDVGPTSGSGSVGNFFVQADYTAPNVFTDVSTTYVQNPTPTAAYVTRNVNLEGQTMSEYFTRPIQFRFYVYDTGSTSTVGGLRIDNIVLNGDVKPVPELPTSVLLALGGLGFVAWQRKRAGKTAGIRSTQAVA